MYKTKKYHVNRRQKNTNLCTLTHMSLMSTKDDVILSN